MGYGYWAGLLDCGKLPRWAAEIVRTAGLGVLEHMDGDLRDNDTQMARRMPLK